MSITWHYVLRTGDGKTQKTRGFCHPARGKPPMTVENESKWELLLEHGGNAFHLSIRANRYGGLRCRGALGRVFTCHVVSQIEPLCATCRAARESPPLCRRQPPPCAEL